MTDTNQAREAMRRFRGGYTLLELIVSLTTSLAILAGISSAILLATKSLETSGTPSANVVDAADAADLMAADLGMALKFTEQLPTAVTFTVPDRDGDSQPETIRYAWSGSGGSLTRQVNNLPSPAAALADGIQLLNLDYLTKTATPPTRTSIEQALDYYTSANTDLNVTQTRWPAQYFQPSLPANAVSWTVTRLRLYLKRSTSQTLSIRIAAADANKKPSGTPLATKSLSTSSLSSSSFNWVDVTFSSFPDRAPGTGLVLEITGTGAGTLVITRYNSGASASSGYSESTNQGSSWSIVPLAELQFQALGTVTTQ